MDNSQSSDSKDVVNSTDTKEIQAEAKEAFESKPAESVEKKEEAREEKRVPLHELYKERNRRKLAEEEVSKLRSRVDELDTKFSKVSQAQDDDDLIAEAEKELGIDREAARKLLRLQKKVAEKAAPRQSESRSVNDPVLQAMDNFKRRASEASVDYDDWQDMIPGMQAVMQKELEQNGIGAYSKSPEYYYSKALRAKNESVERVKKEEAVDRSNNTEIASTESGGSGKKQSSSKINQAVFDANRSDSKWVRENEEEIKQLWRQGKLK